MTRQTSNLVTIGIISISSTGVLKNNINASHTSLYIFMNAHSVGVKPYTHMQTHSLTHTNTYTDTNTE